MESSEILTTDELALAVKWDVQKICRWVRENRLPVFRKVGTASLFYLPQIRCWAQANEIELHVDTDEIPA